MSGIFRHRHGQPDVAGAGQIGVGRGHGDRVGAVMLGEFDGLDHLARAPGRRNGDHQVAGLQRRGGHPHQIGVALGADRDAVAKQPVLGLLRQRRGTATETEDRDLARLGDQLGGLLQLTRVELPFGLLQRPARLAEDGVPERHAIVVADGRRLGQVQRADDEALRQLQLEITHALAADGAAEAGHRRFAHAGAFGNRRIGSVDGVFDIVEHDIGDAAFGRAQLGVGILDQRDDVGNTPDRLALLRIGAQGAVFPVVSFGHEVGLPCPFRPDLLSCLHAVVPCARPRCNRCVPQGHVRIRFAEYVGKQHAFQDEENPFKTMP